MKKESLILSFSIRRRSRFNRVWKAIECDPEAERDGHMVSLDNNNIFTIKWVESG